MNTLSDTNLPFDACLARPAKALHNLSKLRVGHKAVRVQKIPPFPPTVFRGAHTTSTPSPPAVIGPSSSSTEKIIGVVDVRKTGDKPAQHERVFEGRSFRKEKWGSALCEGQHEKENTIKHTVTHTRANVPD